MVKNSSRLRNHLRGSPRVRNNVFVRSFVENTRDFCDVSSLHGMRLLGIQFNSFNKDCKPTRIVGFMFWLTAIIIGSVLGLILMNKIWQRYSVNPTITTIETKNYPISSVLFPGVTICNINVVSRPQAERLIQDMRDSGVQIDKDSWKFFEALSTLITYDEVDSDYSLLFDFFLKRNFTTDKLMMTLAQPCDIMLKKCYWLGKATNCSEIFRVTTSGYGFCCSFNYKALRSYLEV